MISRAATHIPGLRTRSWGWGVEPFRGSTSPCGNLHTCLVLPHMGFQLCTLGACSSATPHAALVGPGVAGASVATPPEGTGCQLWWCPCDPFSTGVQTAQAKGIWLPPPRFQRTATWGEPWAQNPYPGEPWDPGIGAAGTCWPALWVIWPPQWARKAEH